MSMKNIYERSTIRNCPLSRHESQRISGKCLSDRGHTFSILENGKRKAESYM